MKQPVAIQLAGREFHIACEPDERDGLLEAASFLDQRMKKLRAAAKSPGFDRLAALAAIEITHEYLAINREETQKSDAYEHACERLQRLRSRLDAALDNAPEPL